MAMKPESQREANWDLAVTALSILEAPRLVVLVDQVAPELIEQFRLCAHAAASSVV